MPTNPLEEIERAFDLMRHQFRSLDDDLFRGAVPVDISDAGDEFDVAGDLPAMSVRPSTSNSPASHSPSQRPASRPMPTRRRKPSRSVGSEATPPLAGRSGCRSPSSAPRTTTASCP
jgi:hypothetical protein